MSLKIGQIYKKEWIWKPKSPGIPEVQPELLITYNDYT